MCSTASARSCSRTWASTSEVTARLAQTRTGSTAADQTPVDHIQMLSVKMLGSECPKPAPQQ